MDLCCLVVPVDLSIDGRDLLRTLCHATVVPRDGGYASAAARRRSWRRVRL